MSSEPQARRKQQIRPGGAERSRRGRLPNVLEDAACAATHEDTDQRADDPERRIGKAQEPRRDLVDITDRSYPCAECGWDKNDPPSAHEKPKGKTAQKHGNEDHRIVFGRRPPASEPLVGVRDTVHNLRTGRKVPWQFRSSAGAKSCSRSARF